VLHSHSRQVVVDDAGIEIVVLPDAIDLQVRPQQSFAPESGFFKHADRSNVFGNTGSFDPVQLQLAESETRKRLHRVGHQALPAIGLADPVADLGAPGDAMADIAERYAAGQLAVAFLEDEKGHGAA